MNESYIATLLENENYEEYVSNFWPQPRVT